MPFSTFCPNKSCHKQMEPYIDPKTDKVYCSICDQEIPNITHFTKSQMKATKQYRQKTTISFAVKCTKCGKEARPKIVNNDIACASCGDPLKHLSVPFRNMLKEKLKTAGQDI